MDNTLAVRLLDRIRQGEIRAGVVGLGSIGLPIAVALARAGITTVGVDTDPGKVDAVNAGASYLADVASHDIWWTRQAGLLSATTDVAAVRELDTISLCVSSERARAVEQLGAHLHPGMLIVLEAARPGAIDKTRRTLREMAGLAVGRDIFLAVSPDRRPSGYAASPLAAVPKVIGGVTANCVTLASALYELVVAIVVPVSSSRAAEMVQLLESSFRTVNTGLVNEIALLCARNDVDVSEVIRAATTTPYGFIAFKPTLGEGDRASANEPSLAALACRINRAMPDTVVDLVGDALETRHKGMVGASILVVGITCARDAADLDTSAALEVMARLEARGATIAFADPYVSMVPASAWSGGRALLSTSLTGAFIKTVDCVVILADHSAFDYGLIRSCASLIVDACNADALELSGDPIFRLGGMSRARSMASEDC